MKTLIIITPTILMLALLLPARELQASGHEYLLLPQLMKRDVITITSSKLEKIEKGGYIKNHTGVVGGVLKGAIQKGSSLTLRCKDMMYPDTCNLDGRKSPFLFARKTGETYDFHSFDGASLRPGDEEALRKFIQFRDKPDKLIEALADVKNPYIMASVAAQVIKINPEHPRLSSLVSKTLATNSIGDVITLLEFAGRNAHRIKKNRGPLYNAVKSHFSEANHNAISEIELDVMTEFGADNPGHGPYLVGQLRASQNPFIKMLIPYHVAFTKNGAAARDVVAYFRKNPKDLGHTTLEQVSYMLYLTEECDLMQEVIDEATRHYRILKTLLPDKMAYELMENGEDYTYIEQNYIRCMSRRPGQIEKLAAIVKDEVPKGWPPFPLRNGKKDIRVKAAAITAFEMQVAKGFASPSKNPEIKEALIYVLEKGDDQNKPEAMHALHKFHPEMDGLILKAALKPDAEKYHQSHAMMIFLKGKRYDKISQIAAASRFKSIKKIGMLAKEAKKNKIGR